MDNLNKLISGTLASLGILCIVSGMTMPNLVKFENNNVGKLEVNQKQVTNAKTNEIKLKDINIEVGSTLSTNTADYLLNPEDIDESIINRLNLDISNVNNNSVGSYTYTITYNKKIYNGLVIVNEKPLPNVDSITLNSLSVEVNKELPKDINVYIKENLPVEVTSAIRLDISNVKTDIPGNYLYSISYNGKLYTNTITIYEPQIVTDTQATKKEN